MELSEEVRRLIDGYVSEQNVLGSRYRMPAYLLGFSNCKAMFLGKCLPTGAEDIKILKETLIYRQKRAHASACAT